MRSVLQYAAELPQIVRAELEQLLVSFAGYWDKEHNSDGTHSTVTLDRGLFDDGTALLPSITFAADLNTGFYRPGADQIGIATGGVQRVVVGATGYVGIGTASPAALLDVRGGIDTYDLDLNPVPMPTAFTAALAGVGAGLVDVGDHYYYISYVTATGETNLSAGNAPPWHTFSGAAGILVTTTAGNGKVNVTATASTDPRVTGIKIYRTKAGGPGYVAWVITTISNVNQTYLDNVADASLTTGYYARENNTCSYISALGVRAFMPGIASTAVGTAALASVTGGGQNTAFGGGAGGSITTGAANQCFGYGAGGGLSSGNFNVAIGQWTLYTGGGGGGIYNIAIGHDTLFYGANNNYNVAIGSVAGFNVHSDGNVLIGRASGYTLNTGSYNVFLGHCSGYYETGSNKLFIDNAPRASEADARAKALVYGIFDAATLNQRFTVNGVFTSLHQAYIHGTLYSSYAGANSDGYNIWIGGGGQSSIGEVGATYKGSGNVALGFNALQANTKGYTNVAIGVSALVSNNTGHDNFGLGGLSLVACTSGYYNVAIGAAAQYALTTGYSNISAGTNSLVANTVGAKNIALGPFSLADLNITVTNDGNNVAIGYDCGRGIVTGINNTILGANVTGLAAALSNNIILANGGGTIKAQHDGTNWCLQGLVQFVGTSASYPALKRSSAILQCRLADDTGDAIFTAATFREQGRSYALGEPQSHTPTMTASAGTISVTAVADHYSVCGKCCTVLYELDITPSTTPLTISATLPISASSLRSTSVNISAYRVGTGPDTIWSKAVIAASGTTVDLQHGDGSNWAAIRYLIWFQISYYIA